MSLELGSSVLTMIVFTLVCQRSQSFMLDQCDSRHTNLTAQECVGKLILDTLTKVSEDPDKFFKTNELLDSDTGTVRLIRLTVDNGTAADAGGRDEAADESRSSSGGGGNFWDQLVYAVKKLTNYSSDHGVLVSLPQWSKTFPPVAVIDEEDVLKVFHEGRGKHHHPHKKYALLFPLLATFKFLVIKALLVPILVAVMLIKKMMVLGVMALPTVLTMLRFCRNPNGLGFGPGNLIAAGAVGPIGQAAAFAPLTADMSGDYSSYVQQAAATQSNNAYKDYNKNLLDAMKASYQRRR